MSQYSKNEIKVGLFVAVSIFVFIFILFMMGKLRTASGTYPLKVHFNFVSGLQTGAPVRYAGTQVGKVERISILPQKAEANIEVTISVRKDVVLHKDSEARIDTLGMMGEKYVEVSPGSDTVESLQANAVLIGQEPMAMNAIYAKVMRISEQADKSLVVMQKLLENSNAMVAENRENVKETLANIKDVSVEAKELAKDLKVHPWKLLWKGKEQKKEEPQAGPSSTAPRSKFLGIF